MHLQIMSMVLLIYQIVYYTKQIMSSLYKLINYGRKLNISSEIFINFNISTND
jgi:hypothetical protein